MSEHEHDEGYEHHDPVGDAIMRLATPAPVPPSPTDLVVEDWFQRHFHGMGAQLDERLYNLLHAAKEDLKRVLSTL